MNNYKKGNKVTHSSVFDMIPEEYRFEGYQRWMDYARYDWLENPKCEEWDNLIEEEVNGWVPLTFMLCVSVTVWLEVKPWRSWFKYKESALRAVTAYRDVSGYKSEQAYCQLIKWGDEGMIDILDSEVEDFKKRAEKKGLYEDAPEAFYKQIGLILVALKLMQKVYGIHTKKKELEKFIFENVTVAWHPKVVDQCDEYPYEDSEEGDLF